MNMIKKKNICVFVAHVFQIEKIRISLQADSVGPVMKTEVFGSLLVIERDGMCPQFFIEGSCSSRPCSCTRRPQASCKETTSVSF